jgi:hypothetical protein
VCVRPAPAGELLAVKEVTVIEGEKGAEAVQQLEQEVRQGGVVREMQTCGYSVAAGR